MFPELPAGPIGIVAAMPGEIDALLGAMRSQRAVESHIIGQREFYSGELFGRRCVVVLAGIGKVAAAITATTMLLTFNPSALVFVGVAGGIAHDIAVGDVVVADTVLQHDLDASPLFPRFEVPMLGVSRFASSPVLSDALAAAAKRFLGGIGNGRLHRGLVISGDQFVASAGHVRTLRDDLPDAIAVEMEGAAIGQVCDAFDRPFAVLRIISDAADGEAGNDFPRFLEDYASGYSLGIVREFLSGN
ncbi:5'-methylthioadenosine/adenosylhomocysteine nucleosidase [Pararobbsia alpina]|uniref:adenosylhomocysteine nucleosidase n=1 Tax=Pararobbsia alpina TaxID=621374 RepID=A0A6S7BJN0_9BURK|nr:5'-methylthioadenosine/adenosylhomocysteine nucleosidase [Pararobbsia alpina]CAB3793438.1 5'-methylthioadenosine/S-adenosylhomocysteine nucleosidase [Pararobbsia alpina]